MKDGSAGTENAASTGGHDEGELHTTMAGLLPDLRAFARFLVRDRVAADDMVQDALVRALAALPQFQPGTNMKAWLFTILRNAFYESTRRRRREVRWLQAQPVATEAQRPLADDLAALRDLQSLLWRLPPLQREAMILVGAQEMTYEEAAEVCGVPVGTVKARVSRGRAALADALRNAGADTVEPGVDHAAETPLR